MLNQKTFCVSWPNQECPLPGQAYYVVFVGIFFPVGVVHHMVHLPPKTSEEFYCDIEALLRFF